MEAPRMVKKIPTRLEKHGHVRSDNYYWLRERDNPEVIEYLVRQNQHSDRVMAHTKTFENKLFTEITGRIKQTDMSVPFKQDGFYYYTRYEFGKEYPIFARKRGSLEHPEEVMLDANVLAQGHEFFSIGGWTVSTDQNKLAYAIDTQGRRIFTIFFKDLSTDELL